LSTTQGLRGPFQALSGAGKSGLPHWKPWLADNEKRDVTRYVSTKKTKTLEK